MLKSLNSLSFIPNQKTFLPLTHGAYVTHIAHGARRLGNKNIHFSRHGKALSKAYKIRLAG